ncbi:LruC domain-containing protein [Leptospira yasudae]|uniref:LruC domain-containing protein n=1 Tax=Leptospira yasudae TaxID=2202201 RepID=UPI0010848375|nr:LruC domain-containing protein [Leptospira yasudae]TGK27790.1 LruC domain-containing protein [Leptospira yasudae]TGM06915.1 LruC domain-containing protein [Leptospira yasudae]
MKKILFILLAVSIAIGCNGKKKGALWPLLALLNQDTSSSTPANGQSGVTTETASASNGGTVVIVDNTTGNNTVVYPTNTTSTPSSASSGNSSDSGSSGSNSGSSSNANAGSGSGNSGSGSNSGDSSVSSGSGSNSGSSSSTGDSGSSASGGSSSGTGSSSGDGGAVSGGGSSSGGNSDSGSGSSTNSGSGDNVASGGSSSNGGSSSSNSGSGSNNSSQPGTDPNAGSGSSSGGSSAPDVTGVITVNDQVGTPPFNYNTVQTIPLNLIVTDKQSKPVSGATVIVSDNMGNILFQGISDSAGKVSGTITVETSVGQITLEITANGESISNIINLINVIGINREIKYEVLLPVVTAPPADTDKDGIPDSLDAYPQDPTRASMIRTPAEGVSTVAFEDLYPSAGDADLNDYVIQMHNEVDLNAAGDVIRLRGTYQHVARGAGYKHTFFIKLVVGTGAKFTRKVVREDGKEITASNTKTVSAADLTAGLQIHEESNKTTSNPNVNPGGVFKPGHIATIEIEFDSPVKKTKLGNYPYDIFIKVANTGKDIHFPGLYKNADGTDKYLDSNRFPWAILVPGVWKYPYEGFDIRKESQSGYKEFNLWVASNGTSYKEWYKHITNEAKVFPVPDDSGLMGFLLLSVKKNAILVAVLLMAAGATAAYLLKRRTLSQA